MKLGTFSAVEDEKLKAKVKEESFIFSLQHEQVDLAKQILAGMARVEELSKDDADILAKEYPEF